MRDGAGPGEFVSIEFPGEFVFAGAKLEAALSSISVDVSWFQGDFDVVEAHFFYLKSFGNGIVFNDYLNSDELGISGDWRDGAKVRILYKLHRVEEGKLLQARSVAEHENRGRKKASQTKKSEERNIFCCLHIFGVYTEMIFFAISAVEKYLKPRYEKSLAVGDYLRAARRNFMKLFLSLLCLCASMQTVQAESSYGEPHDYIRLMGVKPTPEPETVSLFLALPKEGSFVKKSPVWIQVRLEGYALGTDSYFDRRGEVANSDKGQTLHVVIDDKPYFAVNEPAVDPFKEQGNYYVLSYKFEVPFSLGPGLHTIRMFPARSYGEALKGDKTFIASTFYIDEQTNFLGVDLNRPYLTYNEPSDQMDLTEKKPLLLDFYLSNCELSADGYKVRLKIDDTIVRTITVWQPYYLYGLKRGNIRSSSNCLTQKIR